jgi:hypothetical protein
MTAPNGAKPKLARAVVGLRERSGDQERSDRELFSLLAWSAQRQAVARWETGRACRPSAEHETPEVRLTWGR